MIFICFFLERDICFLARLEIIILRKLLKKKYNHQKTSTSDILHKVWQKREKEKAGQIDRQTGKVE